MKVLNIVVPVTLTSTVGRFCPMETKSHCHKLLVTNEWYLINYTSHLLLIYFGGDNSSSFIQQPNHHGDDLAIPTVS